MKSRPIPKSILRQRPSFNEPESKGKELSFWTAAISILLLVVLIGFSAICAIDIVGLWNQTTIGQLIIAFSLALAFALTFIRKKINSH